MTMWNQEIIRTKLRKIAKSKGLRTPDVQLLLAQERFLSRLLSIPEGQNYVWKGGSLILRRYNQLEKPRFTIDIDLLARGNSIDRCEGDFRRAKALDLTDGFQFSEMTSTEFERDTPYGGTSYYLDWNFFGKAAARRLKIDVCAGDYVDHIEIDTKEIMHFKAHGNEFPGINNAVEYVEKAHSFMKNPPSGTEIKTRSNGDQVFYNPNSNTFAVRNADEAPRTMYKPDPAIHGYPTNLDYFNAQ